MVSRTFHLPEGTGRVVFSSEVLSYMYGYAQRSFWSREAGGQLFSPVVHRSVVDITHVTGPNSRDRRGRHKLDWDVHQANADRMAHFVEGRHVVGLWHTHPEAAPSPSSQDQRTTQQFLEALDANMQAFLLVIIGNKGEIPKMAVWVAQNGSSQSWIALQEASFRHQLDSTAIPRAINPRK